MSLHSRILLLVGVSFTAAMVLVVLFASGAETDLFDWPPFTMVYQIDGASVAVGENVQTSLEVHRLEYRSHNDWVDTIIESPDVVTRVGTFSRVGSYRRLDGLIDTEYDSTTDSTSTDRVEGDTIHLPNGAIYPFQLQGFESLGIEHSPENTDTLVCFKDDCTQNALGRRYDYENAHYVFADDSRGIPIRVGDHFVVRELRVDDVRR